jgi:hypothetical protein
MGTGSFPGINRPERGVDRPTPSSAEVKERAIPLLPHWAFVACYRVNFTFTFTFTFTHGFRAFFLPPEARSLRQILYARECSGRAQRGSRPVTLATDSRWKTYRSCKSVVLLSLHDLATGRGVLGVSFITSLKSNLRTAVTTKNTVLSCTLSKGDCTSDMFIFNWSQAKDGRLSPVRTSAKVNCKLRRQSVWL